MNTHFKIVLPKLIIICFFLDFVRPICISLDRNLHQEVDRLTEFEVFSGQLANNETLNRMVLDRADHSQCDSDFGFVVGDKKICAGLINGHICNRDTGGPLVRLIRIREYGVLQLGITSFVKHTCSGHVVFTNVMSYVDWIELQLEENSDEIESTDQDNNTTPPPTNQASAETQQAQEQFLISDCGEYTSEIHPWSVKIYWVHEQSAFMNKGTVITDRSYFYLYSI